MARDEDREVVFVEREDGAGGLKWLLVGAAIGAGLALLFAPRTGKDLRGEIRRGARRIRHLAEDAIDEIGGDQGGPEKRARTLADSGAAYAGADLADETDEADEADEADEGDGSDDDGEGETAEERPRRQRPGIAVAREELERRLEAARARRRQRAPEEEEPVA